MRSSYRRIGDFIKLVDERNKDLKIDRLLGLSITKEFIPSVANTVGTNMKNYKIIRKNQFACSIMQVRRDKKIPVAILKDYDEAIISQAYPVFRVVDETKLLPDYLMMWMSREEFDREACFLAVGGVRGSLEWEDFLDMELPVPSIEKQREIVAEYNAVVDRIELNETINQKLEETAKAIYRQWFEKFEFPISKEYAESIGKPELEGKPYKSSGGEMVYNEELDKEIPKGWLLKSFTELFNFKGGGTPKTKEPEFWNGDIYFFTPSDRGISTYVIETEKTITELGISKSSTKLFPKGTIFITARGTVGEVVIAGTEMAMNQSCYALLESNSNSTNYYYSHQCTISVLDRLKKEAMGAVFNALVTRDFEPKLVLKPSKIVLDNFEQRIENVYKQIYLKTLENKFLIELKGILLSRISKVEFEIESEIS